MAEANDSFYYVIEYTLHTYCGQQKDECHSFTDKDPHTPRNIKR